MFQEGDVLKFSEEGLAKWCGKTTGRWAERYRKWRWKVIEGGEYWSDAQIINVQRLDIKSKPIESWAVSYFEEAEDENTKTCS